MEKLDLRKDYQYLYKPSAKTIELVEVPKLQFVMIDGVIETGLGPGNSPSSRKTCRHYTERFTL